MPTKALIAPARAKQQNFANLSQEQRVQISLLCAAGRPREEIAKLVGCSTNTVSKWRHMLSGEEWDRIQEEQRKNLVDAAIPIVFEGLRLLAEKLGAATVRELVGAIKVIGEQAAAWGGIGALQRGQSVPGDELEQLLAAGEAKRRQNAIEEALRTGSLDGLKAFAPEADPVLVEA